MTADRKRYVAVCGSVERTFYTWDAANRWLDGMPATAPHVGTPNNRRIVRLEPSATTAPTEGNCRLCLTWVSLTALSLGGYCITCVAKYPSYHEHHEDPQR